MKVSKYVDIGRGGTAAQFLETFKEAAVAKYHGFGAFPSEKTEALIDGAIEAFHEDRPENIQTLLLNAKTIKFGTVIGDYYKDFFVVDALDKLFKKGADQQTAIRLAFAKVPGQDKQDLLNQALKYAISSEKPPSFIKLLHENGASFDAALTMLRAQNCGVDTIDKLEFYQKTMMGKPDVIEVQPEILQQIQEQIRELTEKVDRLSSLVSAVIPAEKIKPPIEKKPYPSLNGFGQPKKTAP